MARGVDTCDICGKALTEDNPKACKLYLSPAVGGKIWRHNEYTSHLDVGNCCLLKVKQFGKWQRRKSRKGQNLPQVANAR